MGSSFSPFLHKTISGVHMAQLLDEVRWYRALCVVKGTRSNPSSRHRATNSKSLRPVHARLATSKGQNAPGVLLSASHSFSSSLIHSAGRLLRLRLSLLQIYQQRRGERNLTHSQSVVLQYRHRPQHPNKETFLLRPVKHSQYRNNLL